MKKQIKRVSLAFVLLSIAGIVWILITQLVPAVGVIEFNVFLSLKILAVIFSTAATLKIVAERSKEDKMILTPAVIVSAVVLLISKWYISVSLAVFLMLRNLNLKKLEKNVKFIGKYIIAIVLIGYIVFQLATGSTDPISLIGSVVICAGIVKNTLDKDNLLTALVGGGLK